MPGRYRFPRPYRRLRLTRLEPRERQQKLESHDLPMPPGSASAGLLLADGAGRDPWPPPAWILGCPLRQVQVEGPDRDQALPVVRVWLILVPPSAPRVTALHATQSVRPACLTRRQASLDAGEKA